VKLRARKWKKTGAASIFLLDNGRRVDTFESQTSSYHHALRDTYRTLIALATASSTSRPGSSEHAAAPCYHDGSRSGFLSPKGSKPRLMTTPFLLTNRCTICVRSFLTCLISVDMPTEKSEHPPSLWSIVSTWDGPIRSVFFLCPKAHIAYACTRAAHLHHPFGTCKHGASQLRKLKLQVGTDTVLSFINPVSQMSNTNRFIRVRNTRETTEQSAKHLADGCVPTSSTLVSGDAVIHVACPGSTPELSRVPPMSVGFRVWKVGGILDASSTCATVRLLLLCFIGRKKRARSVFSETHIAQQADSQEGIVDNA
jgi:hypothetical protein